MIYCSYVYGTETERENLKILSSDEVLKRIKDRKAKKLGFVEIENKQSYDKFEQDVLLAQESYIIRPVIRN